MLKVPETGEAKCLMDGAVQPYINNRITKKTVGYFLFMSIKVVGFAGIRTDPRGPLKRMEFP